MKTTARKSFAGLAIVTALCAVGGCQSDPNAVSFNSIKRDITPEMMTLTERPVDVDRNIAMNWNQNLRGAWMDLGRAMYWDQPSMLSPHGPIETSGQMK
ncbi:MAG TPA: hypothetical protein PKC43_02360 [Phycisphaerales bacterium]|nr:hypothetical protein [Phycisphaerales bacterium]HMP36268.1 hypothetical protein [Phycisphaerales bacterium]